MIHPNPNRNRDRDQNSELNGLTARTRRGDWGMSWRTLIVTVTVTRTLMQTQTVFKFVNAMCLPMFNRKRAQPLGAARICVTLEDVNVWDMGYTGR